jgi:serine protease Do
MLRLFATVVVISHIIFSAPSFAESPEPTKGFADLVEKLSPAVVNISTTQKVKSGGVQQMFPALPNTPEFQPFQQFFQQFGQMQQGGKPIEREVTSLGSGFIIEASGYVITNNHVIEDADEVTVTLPNNDKYKAKIVGRDKKTDLALMKIESKNPLPFVPLGNSDDMRVGDWVIAIGNPYGLGGTVTKGIISARQRSINAGPFDDFLQTDAPINRGNSGGPLFNLQGEVIGINSAIFSPSGGSIGIGFAIPTELAKPIIKQLKEFGRTHRGWLGVKIQEVSEEMADSLGLPKPMGALILDVSPNGPAAKAGIQSGDVITQFGGKEISEMRHLPRIVAETKIGSDTEITYYRKGKQLKAPIHVGELDESAEADMVSDNDTGKPTNKKSNGTESFLGMDLLPLTDPLRAELKLGREASGVVIVGMSNDSPALRRGLRTGDVFTSANGEPIANAAAMRKIFTAAKQAGRKFVMVKIIRASEIVFITLPVE